MTHKKDGRTKQKGNKASTNNKVIFPVLSKKDEKHKGTKRNNDKLTSNIDNTKTTPSKEINFNSKILSKYKESSYNHSQREIKSQGYLYENSKDVAGMHNQRKERMHRNLIGKADKHDGSKIKSSTSINGYDNKMKSTTVEIESERQRNSLVPSGQMPQAKDSFSTPQKSSDHNFEEQIEGERTLNQLKGPSVKYKK